MAQAFSTRHINLKALPPRSRANFEFVPSAAELATLAQDIGVPLVQKIRIAGQLAPEGKGDWKLSATLGATATQACVVTLDPVRTRMDADVGRIFTANMPEPSEDPESEMKEDDRFEPLPDVLDLMDLITEELSLNLPDFPRADGAGFDGHQSTQSGVKPMTDDDAKPFAGLAALKAKLTGDDGA